MITAGEFRVLMALLNFSSASKMLKLSFSVISSWIAKPVEIRVDDLYVFGSFLVKYQAIREASRADPFLFLFLFFCFWNK